MTKINTIQSDPEKLIPVLKNVLAGINSGRIEYDPRYLTADNSGIIISHLLELANYDFRESIKKLVNYITNYDSKVKRNWPSIVRAYCHPNGTSRFDILKNIPLSGLSLDDLCYLTHLSKPEVIKNCDFIKHRHYYYKPNENLFTSMFAKKIKVRITREKFRELETRNIYELATEDLRHWYNYKDNYMEYLEKWIEYLENGNK
jgi:hypothetical protein